MNQKDINELLQRPDQPQAAPFTLAEFNSALIHHGVIDAEVACNDQGATLQAVTAAYRELTGKGS